MEILTTARHFDLTPELRTHVEVRLARDVHPTIGPVDVLAAKLGAVAGAIGAASVVVRSGDAFAHCVELC